MSRNLQEFSINEFSKLISLDVHARVTVFHILTAIITRNSVPKHVLEVVQVFHNMKNSIVCVGQKDG